MGLIQQLKDWAALRRLKRRARRDPSASTYAALAASYRRSGLHEAAARVARDGVVRFGPSAPLRRFCESGDGAHGGLESPRQSFGLSDVTSIEGVGRAALIRGSKAVVSGAIRDGRDPFLRIVRVTAKSAHRFARRNGLGSAAETVLEGRFGCICVCVRGDALAAAQVSSRAQVAAVLAQLQVLVAGAVGAMEVTS